jgi:hypothetical protein
MEPATVNSAFDIPWRPVHLLPLPGVKLSDYVPIETIADSRFLEEAASSEFAPEVARAAPTHEKIPAIFSNLEDWPINTSLCCHECGFTFAGRPVFVPMYIRDAGGRIEMGVSGNYCTWNCAELWIETRYAGNTVQQWRLRENLCTAYRAFTGRQVLNIKAAIPKTELQQFGGDLDVATWHQRQLALSPEHCELPPAAEQSAAANSIWNMCRSPKNAPPLDGMDTCASASTSASSSMHDDVMLEDDTLEELIASLGF